MTAIGRTLLLACLLVLVPAVALAQDAPVTERDLQARADDATRRQDFAAAISVLETIIERFPESKNEQVFWDLGKLCDTYGLDYERAVRGYRTYAVRFSQGRFIKRFQDRLAYLEGHRADWQTLKQFTELRNGREKLSPDEALARAEKLLTEHPETTLKPDIHFWLASQLFKSGNYNRARGYADQYLASFPANGKDRGPHVQALDLCAKIAAKQHDYSTALRRLEEIQAVDPSRAEEFKATADDIRFQRNAWRGFVASIGYGVMALLAALAARPWRSEQFARKPARMLVLAGLTAALTLGPLGLLRSMGERVPPTFWWLAGCGCASVVLLWLAAPCQARIGRKAWIALSFLLVLSFVYASFYVTDMAKVFVWPLEELHRHG